MKLPIWVRALDAAAVIALVLTAFVFLFGGFSIYFSLTPLRVHSTGRLLFIAAFVIAFLVGRDVLDHPEIQVIR